MQLPTFRWAGSGQLRLDLELVVTQPRFIQLRVCQLYHTCKNFHNRLKQNYTLEPKGSNTWACGVNFVSKPRHRQAWFHNHLCSLETLRLRCYLKPSASKWFFASMNLFKEAAHSLCLHHLGSSCTGSSNENINPPNGELDLIWKQGLREHWDEKVMY